MGFPDVHASAAPASIVSKSQYAALKNVSKPRVSQWLAEGKIHPDALVGEGPGAKIDVAKADAHLRRNLDISQRTGNGLSTRLSTPALVPSAPIGEFAPTTPPPVTGLNAPTVDPFEEQIKRERLESLRRDNRKKAEEEAARAGRYVASADSAVQMAKIATTMIEIFEGSLSDLAAALAAKFHLPLRDVLHLLRGEFRSVRERAAVSMREASLAVPSWVEDEIDAPEPPTAVAAAATADPAALEPAAVE